MEISFPSTFTLGDSCEISTSTSILGDASCSSDGDSTFTITSLLNAAFTGGSSSWTFEVGPVTLPASTATVSTFSITTLSDGNEVDSYASTVPFELAEGSITASATPGNFESYQEADYTFVITPTHSVPAGGYIVVTYPEDITIDDESYS